MATNERLTGFWITVATVGVCVIGIWYFAPSWIPCIFRLQLQSTTPSTDIPSIAIDDVFSILNTLFSGIAFAGVVAAIFLQRQELKLQRKELEETREELKGQKDALLKQNELFTLANVHQTLIPILSEYRSSEMHSAINALWKLHEANPDNLVANYEQERGKEGSLLHDQRRLVTHFYGLLGGLYALGVVTGDVLYSYWSERDLRIIPQVLLPIELTLERTLYRDTNDTPVTNGSNDERWVRKMRRLYEDAPKVDA